MAWTGCVLRPARPNGEYNIQFTFKGLTNLDQSSPYCTSKGLASVWGPAPQYCWRMQANYDSRSDYGSHSIGEQQPVRRRINSARRGLRHPKHQIAQEFAQSYRRRRGRARPASCCSNRFDAFAYASILSRRPTARTTMTPTAPSVGSFR